MTRGYKTVRIGESFATAHALVAERALGHPLPAGAQIHHVNGNPSDNRNANLVICQDNGYHRFLHWLASVRAAGGRPFLDAFCSACRAVKPLAEFYLRAGSDMPIHQCKPCRAAYVREHSRRNR